MYLCKSNGWYFGMSSFIKEIGSSVGYHQGDVLASWLYMMTNQPMLEYIDAQVRAVFPEAQYEQLWYVDDENPGIFNIFKNIKVHNNIIK